MISRTNLRQQLMRQQSQLLEQKEKEKKQYLVIEPENPSTAISVPYASEQDAPSGLFTVNTPSSGLLTYHGKLVHPTPYHVEESQNRKFQAFLSQSRRPENSRSLPIRLAVLNEDPSPNDAAEVLNNSTASPSEMEEFWQDFKTSSACPDSVADSGVEPSFSPASEDLMEMLSNAVSASCPTGVNLIEDETTGVHTLEAFKKDRQKKNNHNRIEKKRRCVINDQIKELSHLLPKQQEPLYEIVKDIRQSKGTILKASVDYVKALKEETKKIPKLEETCHSNEQLIRKLKLKIQEYEILLSSKNINIPDRIWYPSTESDITAIVKQEPNFRPNLESQSSISVAENINGNKMASSIHTTSGQKSRSRQPIVQFLTAQPNTMPQTRSVVDSHSVSLSQVCHYLPVTNGMLDEIMDDSHLISEDVLLSSRSGSCTTEDMDFMIS